MRPCCSVIIRNPGIHGGRNAHVGPAHGDLVHDLHIASLLINHLKPCVECRGEMAIAPAALDPFQNFSHFVELFERHCPSLPRFCELEQKPALHYVSDAPRFYHTLLPLQPVIYIRKCVYYKCEMPFTTGYCPLLAGKSRLFGWSQPIQDCYSSMSTQSLPWWQKLMMLPALA